MGRRFQESEEAVLTAWVYCRGGFGRGPVSGLALLRALPSFSPEDCPRTSRIATIMAAKAAITRGSVAAVDGVLLDVAAVDDGQIWLGREALLDCYDTAEITGLNGPCRYSGVAAAAVRASDS